MELELGGRRTTQGPGGGPGRGSAQQVRPLLILCAILCCYYAHRLQQVHSDAKPMKQHAFVHVTSNSCQNMYTICGSCRQGLEEDNQHCQFEMSQIANQGHAQ